MILTIILIILLISGFFNGYRNGVLRQLITMVGYFLSFFVAYHYYSLLAPQIHFIPYPKPDRAEEGVNQLLALLHTEDAYYNVLAFLIIFIAALIVVHMLTKLIGFRGRIPVISQINGLIGGVLGVVTTYLLLFVILYLGAAYPSEWLNGVVENSSVAEWILTNTPILSERFYDWMTQVISE